MIAYYEYPDKRGWRPCCVKRCLPVQLWNTDKQASRIRKHQLPLDSAVNKDVNAAFIWRASAGHENPGWTAWLSACTQLPLVEKLCLCQLEPIRGRNRRVDTAWWGKCGACWANAETGSRCRQTEGYFCSKQWNQRSLDMSGRLWLMQARQKCYVHYIPSKKCTVMCNMIQRNNTKKHNKNIVKNRVLKSECFKACGSHHSEAHGSLNALMCECWVP